MTTAREVFNGMPDPNNVGESEYRVVHEHLDSVIASAEPSMSEAEVMETVVASLDELIEQARTTYQTFLRAIARSQLALHVIELEQQWDASPNRLTDHRLGVELHGKMRRAKQDADAMPDSPEKEQALALIAAFNRRVLVEVFEIDPDKVPSP